MSNYHQILCKLPIAVAGHPLSALCTATFMDDVMVAHNGPE